MEPFLSKQKVRKFRGNGSFRRKTVPLRNIHSFTQVGRYTLSQYQIWYSIGSNKREIIQKKSNQQTSVKKLLFASSCWVRRWKCFMVPSLNEFPGVYEVGQWFNSVNSIFTIILFSCPGQLNRWHCQWVSQWVSESSFDFSHFSDTTVTLQWHYSDTTVTLQWH